MRFFINPDDTYGGYVASGEVPRKYHDVVTLDEVEEIEASLARWKKSHAELLVCNEKQRETVMESHGRLLELLRLISTEYLPEWAHEFSASTGKVVPSVGSASSQSAESTELHGGTKEVPYTHIFKCCCENEKIRDHELRLVAKGGQREITFWARCDHPGGEVCLDSKEAKRLRDALTEWLSTWPAKMDATSDDAHKVDHGWCPFCCNPENEESQKHVCSNCGAIFRRVGLEVTTVAGQVEAGACPHCRGKGYVGDRFTITCMKCSGSGKREEK